MFERSEVLVQWFEEKMMMKLAALMIAVLVPSACMNGRSSRLPGQITFTERPSPVWMESAT